MMLQKLVIQTRMIIEENSRNVNSMKFKLESIQVGKSKSLTINKFRIFCSMEDLYIQSDYL